MKEIDLTVRTSVIRHRNVLLDEYKKNKYKYQNKAKITELKKDGNDYKIRIVIIYYFIFSNSVKRIANFFSFIVHSSPANAFETSNEDAVNIIAVLLSEMHNEMNKVCMTLDTVPIIDPILSPSDYLKYARTLLAQKS